MVERFSIIQNLNKKYSNEEKHKSKIIEGKLHLAFCMEMYREQIKSGRYFLHEHPWSASSWKEFSVENISEQENVYCVRSNMCQFGMHQSVNGKL